jgi:hypothetical protein
MSNLGCNRVREETDEDRLLRREQAKVINISPESESE